MIKSYKLLFILSILVTNTAFASKDLPALPEKAPQQSTGNSESTTIKLLKKWFYWDYFVSSYYDKNKKKDDQKIATPEKEIKLPSKAQQEDINPQKLAEKKATEPDIKYSAPLQPVTQPQVQAIQAPATQVATAPVPIEPQTTQKHSPAPSPPKLPDEFEASKVPKPAPAQETNQAILNATDEPQSKEITAQAPAEQAASTPSAAPVTQSAQAQPQQVAAAPSAAPATQLAPAQDPAEQVTVAPSTAPATQAPQAPAEQVTAAPSTAPTTQSAPAEQVAAAPSTAPATQSAQAEQVTAAPETQINKPASPLLDQPKKPTEAEILAQADKDILLSEQQKPKKAPSLADLEKEANKTPEQKAKEEIDALELASFMKDEIIMLQFSRDEVVLGNIKFSAKLATISDSEYIKYFWKQYEKRSSAEKSRMIREFINDVAQPPVLLDLEEAKQAALVAINSNDLSSLRAVLNHTKTNLLNINDSDFNLIQASVSVANYDTTYYLIMRGANVNITNNDSNQTLVQLANENNSPSLVWLLKRAGAKDYGW